VTADAFEDDMVAAWRWMAENRPDGHVYLSSDIYRHPTYMYLGERATVLTYFEHANPRLSWFDARAALPLADAGGATYLIGASAPLSARAAELLPGAEVVHSEDALTVLRANPAAENRGAGQDFGGGLTLLRATRLGDDALELEWQTGGPVPEDWGGYWLEVESESEVTRLPFDAFRAPEWQSGGRFLTWHALNTDAGRDVRMRVLRMQDGRPIGEGDGWRDVALE
jgi:hypothetical protein